MQRPSQEALARRQANDDARDHDLALAVLKVATENASRRAKPLTARQLAKEAETLWQWVTSDEWPKPRIVVRGAI
jgi:hypothetical protein